MFWRLLLKFEFEYKCTDNYTGYIKKLRQTDLCSNKIRFEIKQVN